jgi:cell wall-associated NlpC family hydrolase
VFDVQGELKGKTLTLRGELHNADLRQQLLRYLSEKGYTVVDSTKVLPDPSLGDATMGIVSVSVANIRTKPEHAAEMGTQALLGTPVRILKADRGGWIYVQTPDEYLGWSDDNIVRMGHDEYLAWSSRPKVIVTVENGTVRAGAGAEAEAVSDVVVGDLLAVEKDAGSFYQVLLPDGRKGVLPKSAAESFGPWLARAKDTPEKILATARRFMGVPYLWGGTSAKGLDCSGFTKTVYYLNGVLLPRDASQQALVGDTVEVTHDFSSVRPGDLLFFGAKARDQRPARVTHVGISLGGMRFIHESGYVRINSLDSSDLDFAAARKSSLLGIKRIIGAGERSGVRRLAEIPYYRGVE